MAQATLPFELIASLPSRTETRRSARASAPAELSDPTAFGIGLDHAQHHLTPPVAHLQAENPVHHGWRYGRMLFGARTLRATAQVRSWLNLRLAAWVSGQAFEAVQVTPHFLRQIETRQCPVTLQVLSPVVGAASEHTSVHSNEPTIERLNTGAAYAAGNLVSMSRQAQQARQGRNCEQALACEQQLRQAAPVDGSPAGAAPSARLNGLDATEWQRMAVLLSFATPLPHAVAARLPLVVLPPARVRVINPVQALQVMLTLQFAHAGYARRLVALAALMPSSELRQAFQVFMHTLLARRLAMPSDHSASATRAAMPAVWNDVLVQRRWLRLSTRLTAVQCEQLLQRASQRALLVGACQWLNADQATDGWSLDSGGQVQALMAPRSPMDFADPAMPGNARSRDSQNVPNCVAVTNCGTFQ
jgi:hypothetical protein